MSSKKIKQADKVDEVEFKKHKYDISIKLEDFHQSDGVDASWLKLVFSGKDNNIKLVNALRRTALNHVPSYAFSADSIKIETNTSVAFNNDYMTGRLQNIPILGIDPDVSYLHEKYWKDINYSDVKRERHPEEVNIEASVNIHNNSASVMDVTTHNMKLYIDNELVDPSPYKKIAPMLIIKLKPNESFKVLMKGVLGIGRRHISWASARNAFYDEIEEGQNKKYEFQIEGNGQSNEYKILQKCCKYLIKRLHNLKTDLQRRVDEKEIKQTQNILYEIQGEDHTIGELLNYEFQSNDEIMFSGFMKPNLLVNNIMFKVVSIDKQKSPLNAMLESFDTLINKINYIGFLISEISTDKHSISALSNTKNKK